MNNTIKTLGAIVLATALAGCGKDEVQRKIIGPDYYFISKGEDISVRETSYPFNSQIVWYDKKGDGNLTSVVSAMATGRGHGFMVLKQGDKGFDKAAEHYRTEVFPIVKK